MFALIGTIQPVNIVQGDLVSVEVTGALEDVPQVQGILGILGPSATLEAITEIQAELVEV